MKIRDLWIYVLPVLMVLMIVAFGALGVKSGLNQQAMESELGKITWKMEPVVTQGIKSPFYYETLDLVNIYYRGENGSSKPCWFSFSGIELTEEEVPDEVFSGDVKEDISGYRGHEYMREHFGEDLLTWTDFRDGLALLYYRDKLVCVNEAGDVVFEKKAHIPDRYIEGGSSETNSTITGVNRQGFCDGLAVFTLDGCKYGVLDRAGNVVMEPVFKGKNTLRVLNDQHIGVFYEKVFRIGQIDGGLGGEA